jgi:hypothetical protein
MKKINLVFIFVLLSLALLPMVVSSATTELREVSNEKQSLLEIKPPELKDWRLWVVIMALISILLCVYCFLRVSISSGSILLIISMTLITIISYQFIAKRYRPEMASPIY